MFTHEDDRRKLIEFANGDFKVAKALIAKENCVVGDHYHKNKDEEFLLLSGHATKVVIGGETYLSIDAQKHFSVPRGAYHRFELDLGSILLGVGSAEFDPTDEIKGRP